MDLLDDEEIEVKKCAIVLYRYFGFASTKNFEEIALNAIANAAQNELRYF